MRYAEAPDPGRERGFTLIEVLVALVIIAVAMSAALRATGVMAANNRALLDKSLALLAAQNTLAQLRLQQTLPQSNRDTVDCPQGGQAMRCERVFSSVANPGFRQVTVLVHPADRPDATLSRLTGILPRS